MTVDDLVDAIYERLCLRQRHQGASADMSLTELRLALGLTEEQIMEAVHVLQLADGSARRLHDGRPDAVGHGLYADEERPIR